MMKHSGMDTDRKTNVKGIWEVKPTQMAPKGLEKSLEILEEQKYRS